MTPRRAARAAKAPRQSGQRGQSGALSAKDRAAHEKYRADKHALRARKAKGAGPAMRKLLGLSIDAEQDMCTSIEAYMQLAGMRRAAYREHVAAMTIAPSMGALIEQLTQRHGERVKVWHNVVSWPVALMIARYGEAPEHWPTEFTADDERRVQNLLSGRMPMFEGVKALGTDADVADAMAASNGQALFLGLDDREDA